jgi:rhodanese-related sulfurtransferase
MAAAPRSPRASSRTTKSKPKTASELVTAAKARIANLSPDAVEQEIAAGAVVVDLREAEELAATGRIPGSVHIPRGMLEFRADPTSTYHNAALDPGKRIILHCAAGGRSALAAVALQEMGYDNVAHLESGFGGWRDAGKPVEGGPKPASTRTRKAAAPKKAAATPRKAAAKQATPAPVAKKAAATKAAGTKAATTKAAATKAAGTKAAAPARKTATKAAAKSAAPKTAATKAAATKAAATKTAATKTAATKTAAAKKAAPARARKTAAKKTD